MLYYDAKTGKATAYNGREAAPASADDKRFLKPDGSEYDFDDVVVTGRATGVPGALIMLDAAQKAHGKLPWNTLFDDVITLSEKGFAVSPFLESTWSTPPLPNAIPPTSRPISVTAMAVSSRPAPC